MTKTGILLSIALTLTGVGMAYAQEASIRSGVSLTRYGDLNHDGYRDKVEVRTSRMSIYFGSASSQYRLYKTYTNVLPRVESDQEYITYYISITPQGVLRLAFEDFYAAGSSETRSYDNLYRFQGGDFYLIGRDDTIMMRNSGRQTITSINYLTRRKQVITAQLAPEGDAPEKTGEKWYTLPVAPLERLGARNLKRED